MRRGSGASAPVEDRTLRAGLGEIALKDVAQLVQFKRTYAPTPDHRMAYDARYDVFVEIYRQMKSVYRKLNG